MSMGAASRTFTTEERRERKRLQNRLNQRARRERRGDESTGTRPQRHPYRVHRWRLFERFASVPSDSANAKDCCSQRDGNDHRLQKIPVIADEGPGEDPTSNTDPTNEFMCSLPADHLLIHLITDNVLRGLTSNKFTLKLVASFFSALNTMHLPLKLTTGCAFGVIRPTYQSMPHSLEPTQLQMNSPHPSWMDMLPFPVMRDSLIRRQNDFSHIQFLEDLIGECVHLTPSAATEKQGEFRPVNHLVRGHRGDAETSPDTKGLIVWGEPFAKESWEATPLFLRNWAWAIGDCDELIGSSNRWRIARGEDPLEVPLLMGY